MSTSQTHVIESQGTHGHVNIRRDAQDAELRTQSYAPPVSSGLNQEADRAGPSIRWSDDVVDNENMGKKKSKKCCIYHKPRAFGDWSDTDSEDGCHGGCHHNNEDSGGH